MGDREKARSDLEMVVRMLPEHTGAHYQLGLVVGSVDLPEQEPELRMPTFQFLWPLLINLFQLTNPRFTCSWRPGYSEEDPIGQSEVSCRSNS